MSNAKEKKTKEGEQPVPQKKKCFLICPIGDPDSPERNRSDMLLEYILKPILGKEYDILRADEIPDPGLIPPQIVKRLIEDDLVIADLSDSNANVFYELAIRHATEKAFIHLMEESQLSQKNLPFDNAGMRTIPYPGKFAVTKTIVCREEIKKAVKAAVDHPERLNTPISIAQINKIAFDLKTSGNPQEEVLARMFDMLREIRSVTGGLSDTSRPPEYALKEATLKIGRQIMLTTTFKQLNRELTFTADLLGDLKQAKETTNNEEQIKSLKNAFHNSDRMRDVLLNIALEIRTEYFVFLREQVNLIYKNIQIAIDKATRGDGEKLLVLIDSLIERTNVIYRIFKDIAQNSLPVN